MAVFFVVVLLVFSSATLWNYGPYGGNVPFLEGIRPVMTSLDNVDAPNGMSWYLVEVNVSNLGLSSWRFDPSMLQVLTNRSSVLPPSRAYNFTSLMNGANLSLGQSVIGTVAFEIPRGEGPATMVYDDRDSGIHLQTSEVPPPSSVASRFAYNAKLIVEGSGSWIHFVITNGVIENTTNFVVQLSPNPVEDPSDYFVFFTGQVVKVNLWFEYLKRPGDPLKVNITSITNNQGFQILGVDHPLPLLMTGWGAQSGLNLFIRVPPGEVSGTLSFVAQATA